MNKIVTSIVLFLIISWCSQAQQFLQKIVTNPTVIEPSAVLELESTSKGFLSPRMFFNQRNAIVSPAAGLQIWCTNCGASGELQVYNGTTWTNLIGGTASRGPGTISNITGVIASIGQPQSGILANAVISVIGYAGGNGGYYN